MKYFSEGDNKERITCLLCQHYCQIKEGQVGICGVNKNENHKLKTLVYGYPSTINLDPVEKKPMYHFLPGTQALSLGTVGCNFQCPFCQNWQISQKHIINKDLKILPSEVVDLAIDNRAQSIAYTYNEPTIFYPYAKDIGIIAHNRGLKNIFVTNGFESTQVVKDMAFWLDGANVDIKSWNNSYYKNFLKGGLKAVKDTLIGLIQEGIWIEITTLLIEGDNDSDEELKQMASFIAQELGVHVPWHLSAFHPDYKMLNHDSTKIETLQRAKKIAKEAGLLFVYLGNIVANNNTYCPNCDTLLIDRKDYRVIQNNLVSECCPKCHTVIKGVWL